MFILFEGPEGGGKSTHAKHLREHLIAHSIHTQYAKEPGGTPIGNRIRSLLLDLSCREMSLKSEFFLFQASRAQLVRDVLRPTLDAGGVVVLDRYWLSTLAYQCAGRGLPEQMAMESSIFATDGLMPDITFLLDVEPEEGLRRTGIKRRGALDRIEQEEMNFHRRVRQGFLSYGPKFFQPLQIISTTGKDPEAVFAEVLAHLRCFDVLRRAVS